MIPFLLTAAAAAAKTMTYVKGGEVILKTTDALTGTRTHPAVAGLIETVTTDTRQTIRSVADPIISGDVFKTAYRATGLHHAVEPIVAGVGSLVNGTQSIVAGIVGGESKSGHLYTGESELPVEAISAPADAAQLRRDAQQALVDASKRTAEAAQRAKDLLKQAQAATDQKKKVTLMNKARAGQRLIKVSELAASDASGLLMVAGSTEDGLRYAMFALDSAQAAKDPPTDPLDVLQSSNVSDEEKERVATIIDQLNRDQEPDYRSIVDMGVGADGVTTAGHDCGGNCGKACCGVKSEWEWEEADSDHHDEPAVAGAPVQAKAWGQFGADATPTVSGGEWANVNWPEAKPKPKKKTEWSDWVKDGSNTEAVKVSGASADDFDIDIDLDDDNADEPSFCSTGTCNRPPPRTTRF